MTRRYRWFRAWAATRSRSTPAALRVATDVDAPVERARAAEWAQARLAEPAPGAATVVFHSIVMQYLPAAERDELDRVLHEAPGTLELLPRRRGTNVNSWLTNVPRLQSGRRRQEPGVRAGATRKPPTRGGREAAPTSA